MTQEETKRAAEVMIAFANGKKIQYYDENIDDWVICVFPIWDWLNIDYRITPDQEEPKEKHYRPYTMEEFVEDMRKHDGFVRMKNAEPYGSLIEDVCAYQVVITHLFRVDYTKLFTDFVWSDNGQPCGKEVEE